MEPGTPQAPREKKIRWALIIVIFFLVGLAIDHFFLHIIFKERQRENKLEPISELLIPTPKTDIVKAAAVAASDTSATPEPSVAQFQKNVQECLGDQLAKNTNPDNLIQRYLEKNPVRTSEFQLENTHVRLPDGSMRRLHLIHADNSNARDARELRYFSLDAEGLPVRIPLQENETKNPRPEFIESLKSQGEVTFHQVKENKILKDGTSLALNTVNNKIFELQVFGKNKTLSCRELDCLCQ